MLDKEVAQLRGFDEFVIVQAKQATEEEQTEPRHKLFQAKPAEVQVTSWSDRSSQQDRITEKEQARLVAPEAKARKVLATADSLQASIVEREADVLEFKREPTDGSGSAT